MKLFLDLLRQPKPSSADLRKALDAIDIPAAEAEVRRVSDQRQALLMEGDDATLDGLEAQLRAARRQVERLTEMQNQLSGAVYEAEIREASEALTAERAAAEAEAAAVAKALRTAYPKIATELVALLARLEAAEDAIQAMNTKLVKANRADELLAEVETRAFPLNPHEWGPNMSILGRTTLAEKPGICPGYHDRPDTGGWVMQSPTGPGDAMDHPYRVAGPSRTNSGFVDTSAGA